MASMITVAKSTVPPIPNSGDVRFYPNTNGILCSIDENGVVTEYISTGTLAETKAGVCAFTQFTGSPKTCTVVFTTAFSDNNYAVNITGVDNRNWTIELKTASGFIINANATKNLLGDVFWVASYSRS